MKKLLLLALVALGGVMNASAFYSLPGSWNWSVDAYKFNSSNTVTITLEGNTTYEFKFYNSDYHDNNYDGYHGNTGTMTCDNCTEWEFYAKTDNAHITTTIAGDYTFTLGWNGTTPKISVTYPTYTRTVTSGNYGTICLPFGGTISNATLYQIDSKIVVGGALKGINISEVGTSFNAGQAYIFKASDSEISVSSFTGSYTDAITTGAIVGNYSSSADVATGMYIIKDNKLYQAGTGVTIGQYRAYIDLDKVTSTTSRGANSIFFGDDATGIESVQNENSENVIFNLQGQRVNNVQKGLVIVGGKKMLRK